MQTVHLEYKKANYACSFIGSLQFRRNNLQLSFLQNNYRALLLCEYCQATENQKDGHLKGISKPALYILNYYTLFLVPKLAPAVN